MMSRFLVLQVLFSDKTCVVDKAETMIGFDVLCFVFVILQMRILQSWYFQHCILEFRTERVLSSRFVYS